MNTLCPKCSKALQFANIVGITGTVAFQSQRKCIAYTCPHCSHAISVQMDPIALNADTLGAVQEAQREILKALESLRSEVKRLRDR